MAFDLSQFETEDTAILTLQNLKGDDDLISEGQPVTIELYSTGSKQGVKALHKAGQQAQLRLQGIIRGKTSKTAAEEADREEVEKLVAITKSISPNFPMTPEALYSNPRLGYLRKQVNDFLGEPSNFAKPSTPNSAPTSSSEPG